MIEQEATAGEVDAFIEAWHDKVEIVSVNMLEYVSLAPNGYGRSQRERGPRTHCKRIGRGDCFVCSNGDVVPCDVSYNGQLSLGNVQDAPLSEIWNGARRHELLEMDAAGRLCENGVCATCTDYDL